MKNILYLCCMALPAAQSCMSYDDELKADADGMTTLSVRGYVYEGSDSDPQASALGGAIVSVAVFDRYDVGDGTSLVEADTFTSDDGYYETRLQLRPDGDVIIKAQAKRQGTNAPYSEASCVYTWKSGLYDPMKFNSLNFIEQPLKEQDVILRQSSRRGRNKEGDAP